MSTGEACLRRESCVAVGWGLTPSRVFAGCQACLRDGGLAGCALDEARLTRLVCTMRISYPRVSCDLRRLALLQSTSE